MGDAMGNADVDFARDRLGNLLKTIRSQSVSATDGTPNGKRSSREDEDEQEGSEYGSMDYEEQMTAPKRRRRQVQKKIIFELRQKAFEIQNTTSEHGLYALCRIWMRGKDSKEGDVSGLPLDRTFSDIDREALLAAKPISRKSTVLPEIKRDDPTTVTGNEESPADILNQYLPRWRKVKKEWCEHRSKSDAEAYGDSLRVLREMHATAQSHVTM